MRRISSMQFTVWKFLTTFMKAAKVISECSRTEAANPAARGSGATGSLFHAAHLSRAVPEHYFMQLSEYLHLKSKTRFRLRLELTIVVFSSVGAESL